MDLLNFRRGTTSFSNNSLYNINYFTLTYIMQFLLYLIRVTRVVWIDIQNHNILIKPEIPERKIHSDSRS